MWRADKKVKPVIGINAGVVLNDKGIPRFSLGGNYTNAVIKAGGIPMILPASGEKEMFEQYLERVDALLLVGGPDIDPDRYGVADKLATVSTASGLRLDFDLGLARLALSKKIPVLGICMGCQVLNVAAGGTLYQDIEFQVEGHSGPHYRKIDPYLTMHDIHIEKDSRLFQIIGKERLEVNSAHHQSVLKTGAGFHASAFSEDGVVECIEHLDHPFAIGIQWHAEIIHDRPDQMSLFEALVSSASESGSS